MKLSEVGEAELVRRLLPLLPNHGLVIKPGEDDAAAWKEADGSFTVATCDASAEGVHFDLSWQSPEDVGWRALALALGDLAAKGARPTQVLVSLSAPREWQLETALGIYRGIAELATRVGLSVAGGDTIEARGGGVLAITALGRTDTKPLPRSAVKPGWSLAVTGPLGAGAIALAARTSLRLEPRLEEGERLNRLGFVCGDISDGLWGELVKFEAMSGCGCELDCDRVPLAPGAGRDDALTSGEETELACAGPSELITAAGLTGLGTFTEGGGVILRDAAGKSVAVRDGGYQHFA
jgi:thiamine-monophosphate kinase